MLLDQILKDDKDYIHIHSLIRSDYNILYRSADCFLIHFPKSNIYVAESVSASVNPFAALVKSYNPAILETTNEDLFRLLRNDYTNSYQCYQFGPFLEKVFDDRLIPLLASDLPYVISTYHDENYIRQLFDRKRILGYYEDRYLVGYIAKHIDGTLGALYVDPLHRKQGYGTKIIKAATAIFDDPLMYSQVVDDNLPSIKLHTGLNIYKSSKKICWMHNTGFLF